MQNPHRRERIRPRRLAGGLAEPVAVARLVVEQLLPPALGVEHRRQLPHGLVRKHVDKARLAGVVLDLETASSDQLLAACRAVADQFKDVVAKQREHLRKLFADSTATDGFKVGPRAREVSSGS